MLSKNPKRAVLWDCEPNLKSLCKYFLCQIWPWSRFQQYNSWLYSFQKAVDSLRQEVKSLKLQRDFLADKYVTSSHGVTHQNENLSIASAIQEAEQYAKLEEEK